MYAIQTKAAAKSESATVKINAATDPEPTLAGAPSGSTTSALRTNIYTPRRNASAAIATPEPEIAARQHQAGGEEQEAQSGVRCYGIRSIQWDGFSGCGVDHGPLTSKETTMP